MSEKMTLRGFQFDKQRGSVGTKCFDLKYEQPFSTIDTQGKHHGMPITAEAAYQIVQLFYDEVVKGSGTGNPFKDILYVEFSKASLFRILSQPGCEHVRIFFAIPDKQLNNASLVLEGLTARGKPVKGKGILNQVHPPTPGEKNNAEDVFETGNLGQYEEKGNGGGGGFTGNIQSFKMLIESRPAAEGTISFQEFMTNIFFPNSAESFE